MKLVKFISTIALVASSFLVSGGNAASVGVTQDIAKCPNWPYCREVEFNDQTSEQNQYLAKCPNWPYCREVDIVDPALELTSQMQTKVILKAA